MSARLLFRVDPVAGESPRGYLCRAAHDHGYSSPNALAQIAGLWVSGTGKVTGLDQDGAIKQLSYTLRLEPEEWRSMCYHHVKGGIDLNSGSARSGGPFGISAYRCMP